MKTASRSARHCTRLGMAALVALAGAVAGPALAADRCPATAPEARSAAFDVDALFSRGGTSLTPSGQVRLSQFARVLDRSGDVELVVISVPRPQGVAPEAWRATTRQRADAVRDLLVRQGVAADRVYTEQRALAPAERQEMASAPLVIEAVGAWQGTSVAGVRGGPTCVVHAMPLRAQVKPRSA